MPDLSAGPALHPLLSRRYSPARFDPTHVADEDTVASLLEAARWAPSAGNSQPWAFLPALRGEPTHERIVRHLAGSARRWAGDASILVVNLCHVHVQDTDWQYSEFSLYDLGQAVAHMVVQGEALGLAARQFRAFDRAGLEAEFAVPPHWAVTTMSAFGRPADDPRRGPSAADDASATSRRDRRPLADVLWPAAAEAPR